MKVGEKLRAVQANVSRVYDAGLSVGEKLCRGKHFASIVTGDGSGSLRFHLPFEPDFLTVRTNAPDIRVVTNIVSYMEIDFSALGQIAGMCGCTTGSQGYGSYANALATPGTTQKMFERSADGAAEIKNVNVSSMGACKFGEGVEYVVTAFQVAWEPMKTRIEKSVARLPNTTCYAWYQAAKVGEVFTEEEWNALIATKPKCTFTLV